MSSINVWEYERQMGQDGPLPGIGWTRHALERARERGIPHKELLKASKLARGCTTPRRVTTSGGTTAVVVDGKVLTVYRGGLVSKYARPHQCGIPINIPRCFLNRHGRSVISNVADDFGCHIRVPSIGPTDPAVVEIFVLGAAPEEVECRIQSLFGPWKVVNVASPGLIVGKGGEMIRFLHKLLPGCKIHVASGDALLAGKPDTRTVLHGATKDMELAQALIRTLHHHRRVSFECLEKILSELMEGQGEIHTRHSERHIKKYEHNARSKSATRTTQDAVTRISTKRCDYCGACKTQRDFPAGNWNLPKHSMRRRKCLACTTHRHADE